MSIFGWALVVYLIILVGVGYYASRKVTDAEEFMVAGRSANKIMLLGTFVATFTSASMWIGTTGFFYKWGWCQIWQGPGTILPSIIIILFIGPYLRRFAQFTIPDFYGERYNSKLVRLIAALIIVGLYFTIMVAQLMGGGRVIQAALGWDYKVGMIAMAVVLIFYSWAGGQRSVIWCDTLQFFVILIASVGTFYYCLNIMGGFGELNRTLAAVDPNLVRGDGGGVMPWTMALAWTCIWGFGNSAQPYTISRFYSAKDIKTGIFGVGLGAFLISLFIILIGIVGVTARIKFPDLPSIDLAFPMVATKLLPTPIGVLAVTGLIAAIISTMDTLLVTLGITCGRDIFQKVFKPNATSRELLFVNRTATLGVGGLAAFVALNPPGPVLVITAFAWSVIASSFFVPLVAGIHWKRATRIGAISGMLGGAAVSLLWFYLNKPFGLHPVLPGLLSSLVFLVVGSLSSKEEDISELWKVLHPTKAKA